MSKQVQSVRDTEKFSKRLHFLLRRVTEAQKKFNLVEEGDRILLAVSGGKDSITLSHLMAHWLRIGNTPFEMSALHAQVAGALENDANREQLKNYFEQLGIAIDFEEMDHSEFYANGQNVHSCFRCAWKRRKELFVYAVENGFNKVAFGHHLDDAAETVLMNLLFHGNPGTMEPKKDFFDGQVTVIRPLILAEEKEIRRVSSLLNFLFYGCLCPADHESQRDVAKAFIQSFGKKQRMVKKNLWNASGQWKKHIVEKKSIDTR